MSVTVAAIASVAGTILSNAAIMYDDITKLVNDLRYNTAGLKSKLGNKLAQLNISNEEYNKALSMINEAMNGLGNIAYNKSDSVRDIINKAQRYLSDKKHQYQQKIIDNSAKIEQVTQADQKIDNYAFQANPFKTADTLQAGKKVADEELNIQLKPESISLQNINNNKLEKQL